MRLPLYLMAGTAALTAVWLLLPRLHRFAYWVARCDPAAIRALATGGWQAQSIEPAAGERLYGLVRPPAADGRWILFLPGNASGIAAAFRPVLDGVLAARPGDGAAFWPWRGFDASDGVPSPATLLADARAAWQHLTAARGVAPERIELWGYSLGTGLAVQLAAELCAAGTPPRRLVLLSAYDRIAVRRAGWSGRLLPGDVYDAITPAKAVRCATVLVHGGADDALPLAAAQALARALGGPAELRELPGRGHVDYLSELGAIAP